MTDFDEIKQSIISAMKSQGTYSEDLELCIELCAGAFLAFKIALNDMRKKNVRSFVKEKSREDNTKLSAHPAFKVFYDSLEVARKQLRELGLTFQTLSTGDDDEVNDLINEVTEAGKDGE